MTSQIEDTARDAGDVGAEVEFISAERLIFFSDAVVAIAITLLAFALPVPQHIRADASNTALWDAVWVNHLDYLTFLISFVVIGRHWRLHHRLFRYVNRLDSRIITLNMAWLLMIVIIPFATRLLSGSGGFGVRFGVYAGIQVLTVLTFLLMSRRITGSELLRPGPPPPGPRNDDSALLTVAAMFAISIPVAFVPHVGQWAFTFWVASAPAARAVQRRRVRDRDRVTDSANLNRSRQAHLRADGQQLRCLWPQHPASLVGPAGRRTGRRALAGAEELMTTRTDDVPVSWDERTILTTMLDYARDTVHAKCAGLTDENARLAPLPGSPLMTIAGLVSHLRWVEDGWIEQTLLGGEVHAPWTDEDPDREWRIAVDIPLEQLLADYRASCARHRDLVASLDLDTPSKGELTWRTEPVTMRWILFHLIEETARHNGHIDILREMADGAKGT